MSLLVPAILVLHLTDAVLIFTASITNSWYRLVDGSLTDLWYRCGYTSGDENWICNSTTPSTHDEWLAAVQGSMVTASLFTTLSLGIFLCQLFTLHRGSLFYLTSIFQIFAGLCVGVACLIYTLHVEAFHPEGRGTFAASFILAWIAVPLTLGSGVMYLHLRKME